MTDFKFVHLVVCALATWRVTSLLVHEDGPFRVFAKLREAAGSDVGEQTFFGGLLECFWCTSVWVAAGIALVSASPLWWTLMPLALSGAAILVEGIGVGDD